MKMEVELFETSEMKGRGTESVNVFKGDIKGELCEGRRE